MMEKKKNMLKMTGVAKEAIVVFVVELAWIVIRTSQGERKQLYRI